MNRVGYSEAAHREAVERFVSYAQGSQALPVLRRWGSWSKSPARQSALIQLGVLADHLLCGDITSAQHNRAVMRLGASWPMPTGDLEVLARVALEFCRCCFFGAGYVPAVDVEPAQGGGGA